MNGKAELQDFGLEDFAATRLLQLYVLSRDRDDSTRASGRPAKSRHLERSVNASLAWAGAQDLPSHLAFMSGLQLSKRLTGELAIGLQQLSPRLAESAGPPVLLEAFTSLTWPKGTAWSEHQPQEAMAAGSALLWPTSLIDVSDLIGRHKSATKRLRKDSLSPIAQVGVGAFMTSAAVLSGGAANVVGTAVGTHILGYSGAAATSAGLAWMGGGSLAAGGAGMAGGALLITAAAHSASTVGRQMLGTIIAKESSGAFAFEVAKLDVRAQLDPNLRPELMRSLKDLERSLARELIDTCPSQSKRAEHMWGHVKRMATEPTRIGKQSERLWRELPDSEERNLRGSIRVVDYELRYLESPDWKRNAAKVPRFFGLPAATKLLDFIDD